MNQIIRHLQPFLGALWRPLTGPRRYQVTSRQNPFALRRQLRRDIHRHLRGLGLEVERIPRGTATS